MSYDIRDKVNRKSFYFEIFERSSAPLPQSKTEDNGK